MTREEKISWLEKASAERLVEQLRWTVIHTTSENIGVRIEGEEDFALVKAELLKRLGKEEA